LSDIPRARPTTSIRAPSRATSASTCRGITQDEYDKKARELKERQTEIALRIEQHQKGEGDFRTTLESLISLASRAAELFERSKTEQKRQLLAFVFSNLRLRGKKLEFALRSPFDLMVNRRSYSSWLAFLNTVRTEHFDQVLALKPLLPSIPKGGVGSCRSRGGERGVPQGRARKRAAILSQSRPRTRSRNATRARCASCSRPECYVLKRARLHPQKYPWLTQLLARRPFKVVAIALANKMARIAWALLAKGGSYRVPRLAAA
jgi:hypothetical protein